MLVRFIFAVIIIYILFRVARRLFLAFSPKERIPSESGSASNPARIGEELVEDPYCHTYVPITSAVEAAENGKKIFFCSRECQKEYMKAHGLS